MIRNLFVPRFRCVIWEIQNFYHKALRWKQNPLNLGNVVLYFRFSLCKTANWSFRYPREEAYFRMPTHGSDTVAFSYSGTAETISDLKILETFALLRLLGRGAWFRKITIGNFQMESI